MALARSIASCIFCKIIKGEIPSHKLIETEFTYSFLDIGPLSRGHALVIPKDHGEKLHDVDDAYLADTLITAKKIAVALGCKDYNVLQNNGLIAHQIVPHVHFHVIPKPDEKQGLGVGWPQLTPAPTQDELKLVQSEILANLQLQEESNTEGKDTKL